MISRHSLPQSEGAPGTELVALLGSTVQPESSVSTQFGSSKSVGSSRVSSKYCSPRIENCKVSSGVVVEDTTAAVPASGILHTSSGVEVEEAAAAVPARLKVRLRIGVEVEDTAAAVPAKGMFKPSKGVEVEDVAAAVPASEMSRTRIGVEVELTAAAVPASETAPPALTVTLNIILSPYMLII